MLWTLGYNITELNINKINLQKSVIKHINILEILFALNKEINDINFTIKFLEIIEKLGDSQENTYILFSNKKILSFILNIYFSNYKKNSKSEISCFNLCEKILSKLFISSLRYMENNLNVNPCCEIETFFLWGDKIISESKEKDTLKNVDSFLREIFNKFLVLYNIEFQSKLKVNAKNQNFNIKKNYYIKNYLILLTYILRYAFYYKNEQNIQMKKGEFITNSKTLNNELDTYLSGMQIFNNYEKISEIWFDFNFFDDLYKKFSHLWLVENILKHINDKKKGNKVIKYEMVLNEIILDKSKKNLYQKELEILCYEETINPKKTTIIPLIKIIPITVMNILKKVKVEKEFNYWLKEFKNFLRFIIISSSNLIKKNQVDFYNKTQEQCLYGLSSGLSFLKDLLNNNQNNFKTQKIEKVLKSLLLFCMIIIKYQYQYIVRKKTGIKRIKTVLKTTCKNDLSCCAVFLLFTEYMKDKQGNVFFSSQKIDQLAVSQYFNILDQLNKQEFKEVLLENQILKNKLSNNFYDINNYINIACNRIDEIKNIIDEIDLKYHSEILILLPKYEKELLKYSNNSIEKNMKYKNIYKTIKKNCFSWKGYWSVHSLFFENGKQLKYKLINHYTKTLMKPILKPVLDINYYLPKFSAFNPQKLFNTKKDNFFSLDIDKILRNESNQSLMNNVKESFGKKTTIKENYQRAMYIKSNPQLAYNLFKISSRLDFGKEEELTIFKNEKKISQKRNSAKVAKKQFLCCVVKPTHHIKGVCFIEENQLTFKVFLNQKNGSSMLDFEEVFDTKANDYDTERQTCFGSYFIYHPKDKDLYKKSIDYNDIKYFFRRKYYYKHSGIEIFTNTNKTYYLTFQLEEDRETVINEILTKIKDYAKIVDDLKDTKDNFDNIIGYENISKIKKANKTIKLSKKVDSWRDWEMSNYEFIIWLNIYSNRSFNDLAQYPVFPWLLTNYDDPIDTNKYRDLSSPMGMLDFNEESKKRKLNFLSTFKLTRRDEFMAPYLYGSNYSNPIYVCNFLTRIFPYTQVSIELQGDKFDDPNRLFTSLKSAFKNATSQKTDVREIIPEFFYLPEMFMNINDLDLGVKEGGIKVNDVEIPCENNSYKFVNLMKNVLESEVVSDNIQNWVDLIFGYQVKGKKAESAFNLFTSYSYQEDLDIKKIDNCNLRFVEFGLIPNQLFSKQCEKKSKKEDIMKVKDILNVTQYIIADCNVDENSIEKNKKIKENEVLDIKLISNEKIIFLYNDFTFVEKKIYTGFDKNVHEEITNSFTIKNNLYYKYNYYPNNIKFINSLKKIVVGLFSDNKIIVISTDTKNSIELFPFDEEAVITSLETDKDENYLFVGNEKGNICIYNLGNDKNNKPIINCISDQMNVITHINTNNILNLWASLSIDGYLFLYTLPLCKLVHCIKIPTDNCYYCLLSSSPLPSIIIISIKNEKSEIFTYSINGKFIIKEEENGIIKNPDIVKDINNNEYIFYIVGKNVVFKKLPYLEIQNKIEVSDGIEKVCMSNDKRILYCMDKNGGNIKLVKEDTNKGNP